MKQSTFMSGVAVTALIIVPACIMGIQYVMAARPAPAPVQEVTQPPVQMFDQSSAPSASPPLSEHIASIPDTPHIRTEKEIVQSGNLTGADLRELSARGMMCIHVKATATEAYNMRYNDWSYNDAFGQIMNQEYGATWGDYKHTDSTYDLLATIVTAAYKWDKGRSPDPFPDFAYKKCMDGNPYDIL